MMRKGGLGTVRLLAGAALVLLALAPILPAAPASAQVPGTLTLDANFHTISVVASFSQAPATTTLEYRRISDSTWRSYDSRLIYVDTRASTPRGTNWTANTAKAKIFGLSPNITYDVRITFDGTSVLTGQITTLDTTPPEPSLRTVYVATDGNDANNGLAPETPKLTINAAFAMAQAGDRIWIKPGTYVLTSQAVLGANGTADNWIRVTKWEGEAGNVIIEGNGLINGVILLYGSYQRLDHLTIRKAGNEVVGVTSYPFGLKSWRWLDNNTITDWDIESPFGDAYAGIYASGNSERTIIVDNYLKRRDVVAGNQNGTGHAICVKQETGGTDPTFGGRHIVWHNTVIGGSDGISDMGEGDVRGGWYRNSDIYENNISWVWDNGIQFDGAAMNVAAWDNVIHSSMSAISLDPITIGPAYSIRNQSYDLRDLGGPWGAGRVGYKAGNSSNGMWYLIHESQYLQAEGGVTPGNNVAQENSGLASFMILNSALMSDRYVIETTSMVGNGGIAVTDYNVMYTTDSAKFVQWWYTRYLNLGAYKAGTGNEANGWSRNMASLDWVNAANGDLRLVQSSPLIDAAAVIDGINNNVEDDTWNYSGFAPDIGAVESPFTGPVPTPTPTP
ncbi:MAG: hypothetical protein KJ624_06450, partial [Chloroflexi bacterium]|nr:hypothetical protein [Chloroflexota bacterium]